MFSNKLSKFSSEHSFRERLQRALIGAKIRYASHFENCTCLKPCCRVKEGSAGGTYNFEHLVRFGNVDFFIVNVKGKPSYFRDTDMQVWESNYSILLQRILRLKIVVNNFVSNCA